METELLKFLCTHIIRGTGTESQDPTGTGWGSSVTGTWTLCNYSSEQSQSTEENNGLFPSNLDISISYASTLH